MFEFTHHPACRRLPLVWLAIILLPLRLFAQDLEETKSQAQRGDVQAQFLLAQSYQNGDGVPKDMEKAVEWYRKAAEQDFGMAQFFLGKISEDRSQMDEASKWYRKAAEKGISRAQLALGRAYEQGRGVKKDEAEAFKWFSRAADAGLAEAQFAVGKMCESGRGGFQEADATAWYRKAAEQGHALAQFKYGNAFYIGAGVETNYEQAATWYRKAAEKNVGAAQFNLGIMCAKGQGVEQDWVEAYKWFTLSGKNGSEMALANRERMSLQMRPEQISEGYRRATEFLNGWRESQPEQ